MGGMEKIAMLLAAITLFVLVLNLPFGYLRRNSRKFSLLWFLYIHLPIPFIFLLRTYAGLDYKVIPVIAMGAVLGQILGGWMNR
jgi:ABC-type spermidine/putrescine transport system permease subunit I